MTSTLQTLNNTAQVDHRDGDLDSFHIHPESNLVYVNHVGLVGKDKLGWTPRRCISPFPLFLGPYFPPTVWTSTPVYAFLENILDCRDGGW